jgi:hypothetical protein
MLYLVTAVLLASRIHLKYNGDWLLALGASPNRSLFPSATLPKQCISGKYSGQGITLQYESGESQDDIREPRHLNFIGARPGPASAPLAQAIQAPHMAIMKLLS